MAVTPERSSPPPSRSEQPLAPDGNGPVRHQSARIEDIDEPRTPQPSRVRIPALAIDAPVAALGVAPSGEMGVPTDASTVAWYEYGPSPGQRGSAVLAAHVDYNGRTGVFFRLADLRPGDKVDVEFLAGGSRTFVVRQRASVAKRALPVDTLFRRTGRPTLTLITCGGEFDATTRSYRSNVVVEAIPLDAGD
jgi:LPXTG-site transpeptidase (sortase) family protein